MEDKGNLAFLELKSQYSHRLETLIATTPAVFASWAIKRWAAPINTNVSDDCTSAGGSSDTSDWWAVKASRGNGGKDVWIVNRSNFAAVISELPKDGELVIQRYSLLNCDENIL
jgi:hypothetical protein